MFITVEGVEGAGKSTLLSLLASRMEKKGLPTLVTREPGGCALGGQIRPLLLEASQKVAARAELFLFLADRAQHVEEVIRHALAGGKLVLCDRYADSTIAYQGYGRGMDVDFLQNLNDFATGGLWPNLTLLLDLPPEEGLARALHRNRTAGLSQTEGRFEAEEISFHARIRHGFLQRAGQNPQRFCILNALETPDTLAREAWRMISNA